MKKNDTTSFRIVKVSMVLFLLLGSQSHLYAQKSATISSAEISFLYTSNDTDGSISGFSSSSTIDLENPRNSVFSGKVKTETLKTGNFLRDWSLKGGKYFDADEYPYISFDSNSVRVNATGTGYTVKGNLTIKDTTKSITIAFTLADNRLTGTTTIYASDFGISVKDDREDNEVTVQMIFTLQ